MVSDGDTGVLMQNCPKASLRMLAKRGGKCFILLSVGSEVKMAGVCRKAALTQATYWSNGPVTLEQTVKVEDKLKLFIIVTITMFRVTIVRHLSADGNLT